MPAGGSSHISSNMGIPVPIVIGSSAGGAPSVASGVTTVSPTHHVVICCMVQPVVPTKVYHRYSPAVELDPHRGFRLTDDKT